MNAYCDFSKVQIRICWCNLVQITEECVRSTVNYKWMEVYRLNIYNDTRLIYLLSRIPIAWWSVAFFFLYLRHFKVFFPCFILYNLYYPPGVNTIWNDIVSITGSSVPMVMYSVTAMMSLTPNILAQIIMLPGYQRYTCESSYFTDSSEESNTHDPIYNIVCIARQKPLISSTHARL